MIERTIPVLRGCTTSLLVLMSPRVRGSTQERYARTPKRRLRPAARNPKGSQHREPPGSDCDRWSKERAGRSAEQPKEQSDDAAIAANNLCSCRSLRSLTKLLATAHNSQRIKGRPIRLRRSAEKEPPASRSANRGRPSARISPCGESAEQPEEQSDEAAIAANNLCSSEAGKSTAEPSPPERSE